MRPQPAHRAHGAGVDTVAAFLRLLLALTARRAGNGTPEPCLSTTRAAGPTPSTTTMCVPRPALFCCVRSRTLRRWQGESIIHDLSQTDYKLDDTDESGTVSALLPQVRRARPAPIAGPDSPKPLFCRSRTATASPFAGLGLRPACASCGRTKTAT